MAKHERPQIENGEEVIRSMFSIDGAAAAIQRSGFDVEEEDFHFSPNMISARSSSDIGPYQRISLLNLSHRSAL